MARGALDELPGSLIKRLRASWNDELCAEHDGTIASFDALSLKLDDLADYKRLFKREKRNLKRVATTIAWSAGAAAVFTPFAYVAAPHIAAALGAAGILGAAGTGTAISSLSGAALSSASLAAIGGSLGMAGGTAFVTAAGAALGAYQGGVVSNAYFGEVRDFSIQKVRPGRGSPVVVVNGFLSRRNQNAADWYPGIDKRFANQPLYHLTWESKCLYNLGTLALGGTGKAAFKRFATELGKRASTRARNPLTWLSLITDLLGNPWHTAVIKASMTGILLADLLARTRNRHGFILCGHSLGARVIFYALQALSTKTDKRVVKQAVLLGGAVSRDDSSGWTQAAGAVDGPVVNCFSSNDQILTYLYTLANAFQSQPIGLGPIAASQQNIRNLDVTEIVDGHMKYKAALAYIFDALGSRDTAG